MPAGAHRLEAQRSEAIFDLAVTDARLGDVVTHLERASGVDLRPVWRDDRTDGLNPDALVTLDIRGATLLEAIERVLERADEAATWASISGSTWQRLPDRSIEIGPKAALNRRASVVLYDIRDLAFEAPNFIETPAIDLQQSLQQAQGGGSAGIPFEQESGELTLPTTQVERAEEIAALVREFVETEQWADNGGTGATMRLWRGQLVVRAPEYIHRQLRQDVARRLSGG
jgi:hypothetical protein